MAAKFTVDICGIGRRAALEALGRMVETGDGPMIHPVDAGKTEDPYADLAEKAEVVALLLRPEWSEGYINARVKLLADRYGGEGRLIALVGVSRKKLSPESQAVARWVIY
jgi:hypothetical protein